jgi:GNAT superfamily N-acetyltransferase
MTQSAKLTSESPDFSSFNAILYEANVFSSAVYSPIVSQIMNSNLVHIRPAVFTDAHAMSLIAAKEPLLYVSPWVWLYKIFLPSPSVRPYAQNIQMHLLQPRSLAIIATLASNPKGVVGYALFSRLGNDDQARALLNSKSNPYFTIFRWLWTFWLMAVSWIYGKERAWQQDIETEVGSWSSFSEQWFVKSLVVQQEWRRKGVGTQLMGIVLEKAAAEGAPVILEATVRGEKLYTALGFKVIDGPQGDDVKESGTRMLWHHEAL